MKFESKSAIIILNYNKYELTERVVNNLINIKYNGHIVIVDNDSQNESFKILDNKFGGINKKIHVIKSNKNGGYAYGNNIGIKYILGKEDNIEYIGIMNPDVILESSFSIEKLISNISERNDIAGITAMQLYNQEYSLNKVGWKLTGYTSILLSNLVLFYKFMNYSKYKKFKLDKYNNSIAEIDVMAGCFFILKSDVFKQVGYLDENTFLYYEENILAKKVRNHGYRFVVDLSQFYIHDHQEKSKDAQSLKYRMDIYKYSLQSQKYYLDKYLKINSLQKILLNFVSILHMYIEIPMIHIIMHLKNKKG